MLSRRLFVAASAAAALPAATDTPALLGGTPIRQAKFPSWPVTAANDMQSLMAVLRSGIWNRRGGGAVTEFETAWADRLDARHAVATNGGTTALWAALNALEIGPKDEVIVPPYTFAATVNVILLQHALPVFVDTDRETFQIDASKIEAAITSRTRAIMPVHLGGASADMDAILAVAKKHNLAVIEDACQSHLAEWKGKPVGTLGDAGCFSFQASKNLNCGEGGCLVTNSAGLYAKAAGFHDNGRAAYGGTPNDSVRRAGCNLRMTAFQAAILNSQLLRLEEQSKLRQANASYLTKLLNEIPGIRPAREYAGCTRNAYHLYMFRYDPASFEGLPRDRFREALQAEGIPCSTGYRPLNHDPFLEATFASRAFRAIYSEKERAGWRSRNHTPENDQLCGEALWLTQTMLLGGREDMEQIAEAIGKLQRHAGKLARG